MEDLIRQVEGKFKFSIADSTMMLLVQQAMDKAHEKIKSRNGTFGRLNHISKFYELAVMQLDGCLKFVQQEADNYILESNYEEVLVDLREIRDRLNQRLLETELAILEKDKVLLERLENEERLKEVLESKETELNLERTRSEGLEEFIKSNILEGTNEATEGTEISELKRSVDQQVMNLRQKLEPKHKLLAVGEEVNSKAVNNKRVVKMGVDINVLKGTMDLAFSKMRNAIFLSELGPIEQMWRWTVEKDTITILIKGFMENERNDFEEENKKVKRDVAIMLRDHIFGLADQILLLRGDIECLAIQNQEVIKSSSLDVSPKQRIDEIIARLDNLIDLNSKLNESFWDDRSKMAEKTYSEKRLSQSEANDCKKVILESLDDVKLKMSKRFVLDKAGKLQEEKEDAELLGIILEDIYLTLFKDLVNRFHMDLLACTIWSQIEEELHNNIIDEITNEGHEEIERENVEIGLREEISRLVLIETAKSFSDTIDATLLNFSIN